MFQLPRSLLNKYGLYNDIDTISFMETEQFISQALKGNQQAITHLYNAYLPKMVGVCTRIVSDKSIAEELAHDAFILAMAKLNQLSDPNKFGQWLTSITHHIASRYVRRDRTPLTSSVENLSDKEVYLTPALHYENNSLDLPSIDEIMKAVDNLPEGYGKVFKMSVIQGMSHAEIAEILGIAAHTSSSQLARAKKLLRKALSSYWVLLLVLLITPLAYLLLRQWFKKDIQEPVITKQEKQEKHGKDSHSGHKEDKDSTNKTITPPVLADNSNLTPIPSIPNLKKHYIAPTTSVAKEEKLVADTIDRTTPIDTLRNIAIQSKPIDSLTVDSTFIEKPIEQYITPNRDIFITDDDTDDKYLIPIHKETNNSKWNLNFAYSGNFGNNNNLVSSSILPVTPPAHTGWPPIDGDGDEDNSASTNNWYDFRDNLYMWREEYKWSPGFYEEYGPNWTIDELNTLIKIAEANIEAGNEEITRESHHDLPFTFSLALQHRLTNRWSIESGLSYTLLSSQFTTGEPFAGIIDRQKIQYIGIPMKASYNWLDSRQWSLYASLGFTMDIPISSSVSSDFVLNGSALLNQKKSLNVPLQWSTGIGIGFQYHITPYLGIFAEPSFQYYIPDGSSIETYRTEHPYNFTLPIGFRFSW